VAVTGRIPEAVMQPLASEDESGSEDNRRSITCTRPCAVVIAVCWAGSILVAWLFGRAWAPPSAAAGRTRALAGREGLHAVFQDYIREAKHVDLTHPISPSTPVWPGFGPSQVMAGVAGARIDNFCEKGEEWNYGKFGFITTAYKLTTDQLGTQLDPPSHWNELGATISDLPATYALRPLVVVDIHEKVVQNASYHATPEDVYDWEETHGIVPKGSVVMFRSDWHKGWNDYMTKGTPAKFPGVTLATLKMLHNERGILFHGHEPLDTDMTPNLEGEAWLMHNNFAQAEGVANLDQVPVSGCLVSIGFAKTEGGSGGYARYVAICPPDAEHGISVDESPGAPLAAQPAPLRRDDKGVLRPSPLAAPTLYCVGANSAALGCVDGKPGWN